MFRAYIIMKWYCWVVSFGGGGGCNQFKPWWDSEYIIFEVEKSNITRMYMFSTILRLLVAQQLLKRMKNTENSKSSESHFYSHMTNTHTDAIYPPIISISVMILCFRICMGCHLTHHHHHHHRHRTGWDCSVFVLYCFKIKFHVANACVRAYVFLVFDSLFSIFRFIAAILSLFFWNRF